MAVRREGNFWYFVIDLPRGEDGKRRQLNLMFNLYGGR
jgi:hypothetical protein